MTLVVPFISIFVTLGTCFAAPAFSSRGQSHDPVDSHYAMYNLFNSNYDDYIEMLSGTPPFRVKLAEARRQRSLSQPILHYEERTEPVVIEGNVYKRPPIVPASAKQAIDVDSSTTSSSQKHPNSEPNKEEEELFFHQFSWQKKFLPIDQRKIFKEIKSNWGDDYGNKSYKRAKYNLCRTLTEHYAKEILYGNQQVIKYIAEKTKPKLFAVKKKVIKSSGSKRKAEWRKLQAAKMKMLNGY